MDQATIDRARSFASEAHGAIGQKRKYTGEDYIFHPIAVADIVKAVPHTEAMVCAALLHDVVEDTPVTVEQIHQHFGWEVAALVEALTDVSRPSDGNRRVRKALDRARLAAAPADAQTIKVADLIDNTRSIVQHDPDFAVVYMHEKRQLLDALTMADPILREIAEGQLRTYEMQRRAAARSSDDELSAINRIIDVHQRHGAL